MNWEAIGAVAELLAAVGVIVSLVYLAAQIRQNTRSVRMASHHGIADLFTQATLAVVHDPDLGEILRRGVPDPEALTEAERTRFFMYLLAIFRTYEEIHELHRRGLIDLEFWEARRRSMRHWLSTPGVRSWWSSSVLSDMFVDAFRLAVEEEIESLGPATAQTSAGSEPAVMR